MTAPGVSVLLPVRDEAPYLGEALASLSAQTFSDFEVIVVDEGSRDGSAEIATTHARSEVARSEIREAIAAEGRRDAVDFVAVA